MFIQIINTYVNFCTEIRKPRVWAEDPVVQARAWLLLHQDILGILEGSKESNSYLLIPGDTPHPLSPLGNAAGYHYQSYIPLENIPLNQYFKSPNIPSSPEYNKNKIKISSSKPERSNDYDDVLKPFQCVTNMIIDMKERHQSIVSNLDVLTNEFRNYTILFVLINFLRKA